MPLIKLLALFAIALAAYQTPAAADHATVSPARTIVEGYTKAYNDGDLEAMSQYMHDEIQWITIEGDKSSITTQGKTDLLEEMAGYFKSPIRSSSTLHGWSENGAYISVIETASWTTKSGSPRSQSANAVYLLEDNLIRRVWYFPAQQVSD